MASGRKASARPSLTIRGPSGGRDKWKLGFRNNPTYLCDCAMFEEMMGYKNLVVRFVLRCFSVFVCKPRNSLSSLARILFIQLLLVIAAGRVKTLWAVTCACVPKVICFAASLQAQIGYIRRPLSSISTCTCTEPNFASCYSLNYLTTVLFMKVSSSN